MEDAYFSLLAIQVTRKLNALTPHLDAVCSLINNQPLITAIVWAQARNPEVPMTKDTFKEVKEMLARMQGKLAPLRAWAENFEQIDYAPSKDEVLSIIEVCNSFLSDLKYTTYKFRQLSAGRHHVPQMQQLDGEYAELLARADKLEGQLEEQSVHLELFM